MKLPEIVMSAIISVYDPKNIENYSHCVITTSDNQYQLINLNSNRMKVFANSTDLTSYIDKKKITDVIHLRKSN